MGLASITVTGTYKSANGALLTSKTLTFTPISVFGDGGIIVPKAPVKVTTDAATAAFSLTLLTSDLAGAYIRYQVQFSTGDKKRFDLADDLASTTLEDLINAYDGAQAASAAVSIAALEAGKVDGTPGVKVYRALLTQTGTSAPVATVLENSIGAIVWSRPGGAGAYVGSLIGAFPANKTFLSPIALSNLLLDEELRVASIIREDADNLSLLTGKVVTIDPVVGSYEDGYLTETALEILVYP